LLVFRQLPPEARRTSVTAPSLTANATASSGSIIARFYIDTLRAKSKQHGLSVLGYCLLTNHVHLVAVPRRPPSLAGAIGQTHWRYTMRFNRCYSRSGHLWQNRFYSCPLGPTHLVAALAYVDLNQVRAGLVGEAAHHFRPLGGFRRLIAYALKHENWDVRVTVGLPGGWRT